MTKNKYIEFGFIILSIGIFGGNFIIADHNASIILFAR